MEGILDVNKRIDISKELEIICFNAFQNKPLDIEVGKQNPAKENFTKWMLEHYDYDSPDNKTRNAPKDQLTSFQRALKVVLIIGQIIGLIPVKGIFEKDARNIRFKWISWRIFYSFGIATILMIQTSLSLYKLMTEQLSISILGFVGYFLSSVSITLVFIRVASKWPDLFLSVSNSGLDKYIDPKLVKKCTVTCVILFGMILIEYVSFSFTSLSEAKYDMENGTTIYEAFIMNGYPWFNLLNLPFNVVTGIILQSIGILTTIIWSYNDVFIVCISLYLSSVLHQLNNRITEAADKGILRSSVWGSLRADYTDATRLVRLFDNTFSGLALLSFGSNLFFVCIQIFNLLTSVQFNPSLCYVYSVFWVLGRFVTVSLIAAEVHTAAQAPASTMYNLPACAYCKEVKRFLEQLHGDTVALSGLQFFSITKELVLTIAGTIVTYELVLLQIGDD